MISIQEKIRTIINNHTSPAKISHKKPQSSKRIRNSGILEILHQSLLFHYVIIRCIPKIIEDRPIEGSTYQAVTAQVTLRLEDVTTGEILETIGYGAAQDAIGKAIVAAMLSATKHAWLSCIQNARR